MALSAKQERFVAEYLLDLNATQAAIRAGYSAPTAYSQGQRLLKHVEVSAAVDAAMIERGERTQITADRVLKELAKIAFSDIRSVLRWRAIEAASEADVSEHLEPQPHGGALKRAERDTVSVVELVDSEDIEDDAAAAVAEVSQTANGLKIKLHDKRAALVDIGKHLGMFIERVDHSGSVTVRADELDERL